MPALDVLAPCHEGQREAVADDSRTQAWITTRRAGKTRGMIYRLIRAAASRPAVNCLYLTTTIKRGINTLWAELVRIAGELGVTASARGDRHVLTLKNGSAIWISGCETRVEADAWRGVLPRTALVCLDEAQDWKDDLLGYTITSVVLPSLGDIGGGFILAGTPRAPRGFLFNFHKAPGVSSHWWSWETNPWATDVPATLAETMRIRGCDELDPSIRREFFGEFVTDTNRQIFGKPKHMPARAALPKGKWSYVIGSDFGSVDAAAVVVWGWTPLAPHLYVVETVKRPGLGASAQVELVRTIAKRYEDGLVAVVGDPGGGGAGLIIDLRREHQIAIVAAEKSGKAAACVALGDGIRSGKVAVVAEEAEFVSELETPEWDADAVEISVKGHMPDRVDASLYGYRRAIGLHHYVAPPPPKSMQEEELDRLAAEDEARDAMLRDMGVM